MVDIAGGLISAGIKGIASSIFGDKSKPPTTSEIVVGNAEGARKAADLYGFNPLTMLQYGATSGGGGAGAGSLVSNELLLGAVQDVSDVVTGEDARRRAAEDLQNDLQKIRIEQARDGVVQITDRATDRVGSGPAVLGRTAAEFSQSNESVSQTLGFNRRPQSKPDLFSNGEIPVIGPDGGHMRIPRVWADRLKLDPWDAFIMEDYEAIVGDEAGQIAALPKIPQTVFNLEGGVFDASTTENKRKNAYPDRYRTPTFNTGTNQRYLNRRKQK